MPKKHLRKNQRLNSMTNFQQQQNEQQRICKKVNTPIVPRLSLEQPSTSLISNRISSFSDQSYGTTTNSLEIMSDDGYFGNNNNLNNDYSTKFATLSRLESSNLFNDNLIPLINTFEGGGKRILNTVPELPLNEPLKLSNSNSFSSLKTSILAGNNSRTLSSLSLQTTTNGQRCCSTTDETTINNTQQKSSFNNILFCDQKESLKYTANLNNSCCSINSSSFSESHRAKQQQPKQGVSIFFFLFFSFLNYFLT